MSETALDAQIRLLDALRCAADDSNARIAKLEHRLSKLEQLNARLSALESRSPITPQVIALTEAIEDVRKDCERVSDRVDALGAPLIVKAYTLSKPADAPDSKTIGYSWRPGELHELVKAAQLLDAGACGVVGEPHWMRVTTLRLDALRAALKPFEREGGIDD